MMWESEEGVGKIEKGANDSLSVEYKEEIQVILHKSIFLIIRILNNNNNLKS